MGTRLSWLKHRLRESLFRNTGIPYRNLIGLALGLTAALLLLSSRVLLPPGAALWFIGTLATTMLLLIAVRPYHERKIDRFAWGLLVIIILGFGLGALIYQYRGWWKWLWSQYRRINTPDEIILESLFLLGVILGVYVVRNWAKEQKAFQESLSGALGGTFIAAVLGKLQEGLTPLRAFAYYALGFTMSGTVNLILAARLTAKYTNRRSITSRALLDFLYGSERAKLIDGYFLKNFEEDKDYAKKRLTDTLIEYRKLVAREFAARMEKRRRSRERAREEFVTEKVWLALGETTKNVQKELKREGQSPPLQSPPFDEGRRREIENRLKELEELEKQRAGSPPAQHLSREVPTDRIIEILEARRKHLEPACPQLKEAYEKLKELQAERESIISSPAQKSRKQQPRLRNVEHEIDELKIQLPKLTGKCDEALLKEWLNLEQLLSHLKPSYFYWLIAIECEEENDDDVKTDPEVGGKDRAYNVVYKYIGSDEALADPEHSHMSPGSERAPAIKSEMFRVGVALRWRDLLEYIVAPGEYGKSFPYFGSVAGLALIFRKVIIMDRDLHRTFRNSDHPRGICPRDLEQDRGLDEVDFLSYISIPVVNPQGDPAEAGTGIVNIDTRLFVTRWRLGGQPVKACEGIFRMRLTPRDLTEFANNLYDQDDEDVKYIEEVTKIIMPVLVLYAKCRIGAT